MKVKAKIVKQQVINYITTQISKKEEELENIILERAKLYKKVNDSYVDKRNKEFRLSKLFGKFVPEPYKNINQFYEEWDLVWDYMEGFVSKEQYEQGWKYTKQIKDIEKWAIFAKKILELCNATKEQTVEFNQDSWNMLMS